MAVALYGTLISDLSASGDLEKMKTVAAQAEAFLASGKTSDGDGDIPSALKALRAEIARLENK